MNSDGEEQADEQYLDAYEGSWWGNQAGLQGQEEPERPPGLTSSSAASSSQQALKPLGEPIGGPSGQNPAPAEGRNTSQEQGNAIHHARWKLLADVPSLQVGSGEPWEVGMRFRTWLKQLDTVAGTIAPAFSTFVTAQVQLAEQRHGERMAGLVTLGPPPDVDPRDSECESRLILLLIRCLPQEWKTSVLEQQDESKGMRALDLLEGVFEVLQPGGAAEMQSLNTFVRTLRPVTTAKDGLSVLRRWRLARTRATALALPKLAPFEELQVLSTMAQTLERRHDRFRTLLGLLRTDPDIIRPTAAGVEKMVTLIEQQLQLLSA